MYPVMTAFIQTFAHFGTGIGIYFLQLPVLSIISLLGGMIMIMAIYAFNNDNYGVGNDSNRLVSISATCEAPRMVVAVHGCPNGAATCEVEYRPNCELPFFAVIADMGLSVFVCLALFASKLLEGEMIEELDEAIQTAQDYSVEVTDPNADADDPDEWRAYFEQFGPVQYISITRKNNVLMDNILIRHKMGRDYKQLLHEAQFPELFGSCCSSEQRHNRKIRALESEIKAQDELLIDMYDSVYDVCRVYVTFNTEEAQRACKSALEVANIDAILDRGEIKQEFKFRGANVLNIAEPVEPGGVLWHNMEIPNLTRNINTVFTYLLIIVMLGGLWFLVIYVSKISSLLLAAIIGAIDAGLPTIFTLLADMAYPHCEGARQSSIQIKLFVARILLSTIFPFAQQSWKKVLSEDYIRQIIQVQLFSCFLSPFINLLDLYGITMRNIIAPFISITQEELNSRWLGTYWILAERYTAISKILFISLFYALLYPAGLLISTAAFLFTFCVDRFLLLRRWQPVPMLGPQIAVRVRHQALLAVCVHMWATTRFIYSWPMDSAYVHNDGTVEDVDKFPSYYIINMHPQDWHIDSQKALLMPYIFIFYGVTILTAYVWILDPLYEWFHSMFFKIHVDVGDSQGINFNTLEKIPVYVPIFEAPNQQQYLCSAMKKVQYAHKPQLIKSGADENLDLSVYVPVDLKHSVLSIVKYYGDKPLEKVPMDDLRKTSKDLQADRAAIAGQTPRDDSGVGAEGDLEAGGIRAADGTGGLDTKDVSKRVVKNRSYSALNKKRYGISAVSIHPHDGSPVKLQAGVSTRDAQLLPGSYEPHLRPNQIIDTSLWSQPALPGSPQKITPQGYRISNRVVLKPLMHTANAHAAGGGSHHHHGRLTLHASNFNEERKDTLQMEV